MLLRSSWPYVLMAGLLLLVVTVGFTLVVVLWPTERSGRRLLRRWGGPSEPTADQIASAVRYLRDRRLLVLPSLLLLVVLIMASSRSGWPALDPAALLDVDHQRNLVLVLGALLAALLFGEVTGALRRPYGQLRTATLVRRDRRDLLPRWAVRLYLGLTAVAVVAAVAGLFAQRSAQEVLARFGPDGVYATRTSGGWAETHLLPGEARVAETADGWWLLACALAGLFVVAIVVSLATGRRVDGDEQVDMALRKRSAQVVVGIGIWWTVLLAVAGIARLGLLRELMVRLQPPGWLDLVRHIGFEVSIVVVFTAAAAWGWLAAGPRRTNAQVSV